MKISIIISTLNAERYLQECLDSIRSQIWRNYEVIIVDGASVDGTLAIINQNLDLIDRLLSEPDHGIYDAWNKAISLAAGDWLYFLGSDDYLFEDGSLSNVMKAILPLQEMPMVVYGKVAFLTVGGEVRILGNHWHKAEKKMYSGMAIPHQGVFHSKELFRRFGGFDASLLSAGDYKLIMRSMECSAPHFLEDCVVAVQRAGGKSGLRKNRLSVVLEFRRAQSELGRGITIRWIGMYIKGCIWFVISKFIDPGAGK